jgi:PAS domain S-box-containing protein
LASEEKCFSIQNRIEKAYLVSRLIKKMPPGHGSGGTVTDMIKVLLVDDESSFLDLSLIYLGKYKDLEASCRATAIDAMEVILEQRPDVIVSDYQMPGMDGMDLLKEIRRRGIDIPFILFTGKGREEVAIEALNNGADFYLQKGGDPKSLFAVLVNAINHLFERRKAELALRESEERYRVLSENVRDYMWYMNLDMEIEYVSPSVKDVLGYTQEEYCGIPMEDLLTEESLETAIEARDKMIESGKAWGKASGSSESYVMKMVHRNGSIRLIEHRITFLKNKYGNHQGFIGVALDVTERVRQEEEMLASREILSQIIQGTLIPTFVIDGEHRVTHWNQAAEEITGMLAKDVLGTRDQWRAFYMEDRPVMADLILEEATDEEIERYHPGRFHRLHILEGCVEAEGYFPDMGDGTWLYITATPLRDKEGTLVGAIETTQDITERKKAEEALVRSEAKYRAIFENTGSAMMMINSDGIFNLVNSEFESMSGYSRKEIEGKASVETILHPEERERMMGYHYSRREEDGGVPDQYEFRLMRKDGGIRHGLISVSLIPETGDSVASILDVTEKKNMEKRLNDTMVEQSIMLDNIDTQIWVAKDPETYGTSNLARARFMGCSKEWLEGRKLVDVLRPEDAATCIESNRKAFEGQVVTRPEWLRTIGGELRCTLVTKTPMMSDGKVDYLLCTAKDVTDLKRANEAVEQLNEVLNLINKILRHDLLNELSIISAALELQIEEGDDSFMEKALRAVSRSSDLINRMREFESLLTMGVSTEPRSIGEAARNVLDRHSLDYSVEGDCEVMADEALESAFENIVRNAITHGKATRMDVSISCQEGSCVTRIADDGEGIPEDIRERIFERGFKHGPSGGTGLGLYLVKKMVERYHGDLSVLNNSPRGTIFELRFPATNKE